MGEHQNPHPFLRLHARLQRVAATLGLALVAALPAVGLGAQDPPGGRSPITIDKEKGELTINIDEREGLPLKEFIKYASLLTGKNFTFNPTELGGPGAPDPTITFLGVKKMKISSFFSFFQTMLYIKGFGCIVRGDGDTEIIEIINITGPKTREMASASRYVPVENLQEYAAQTGVQIITSVPLQHLNATAATNSLRPFFLGQAAGGPGGPQFGQVGNAKAILIQGFGPQVYAAYRILNLLDVPIDTLNLQIRVQKLEHQDAAELEQILNDVLNDRTGRARGAVAPGGASGAELPLAQQQPMRILPVPSQNALVLSGTPEQVLDALNLIATLDVPTEVTGGDTHVVPLKNVLAEELQTTLREFINADVAAEQAVQAGAPAGGGAVRRARKTVVYAHKESNSLLISGTASKYAALLKTIDELDRRQPQVLIECAVVELTTSTLTRIGVELGFLDIKNGGGNYSRPFGFSSFGLSTFQDTNDDGLPDTRLPDFENPLQGVTGGIIGGEDFAIPVLLNALAQDNEANILSLPSVIVNNNENAFVQSKEDRPTSNVSQGTATTQSGFQGFQGAGIDLNISPSISTNNYLRLNVGLEVSRFLFPFDPAASNPGPKTTRKVTTQVTLPSGHTMVLGGVIEDQISDQENGIPLLKDIPLLGYLFRNQARSKNKTNLYFFLTPHILNEDDFSDLAAISFRKKLEAAEYIGHRRLEMVDPKWSGTRAQTLEDPGATIEDLDRQGGFQIPVYARPERKPTTQRNTKIPVGAGTQPSTEPTTRPASTGPTSPGRTNGN